MVKKNEQKAVATGKNGRPKPDKTTTKPSAKPNKPTPPPQQPPAQQSREREREIIWPEEEDRAQGIKYVVALCYEQNSITVQQSKDMLGWTEVKAREGSDFTDRNGKHIVCTNNTTNREIKWLEVEKLVQIHLTRRVKDGTPAWKFNGEDILIGMYGAVLNGQKSMIAHVLAEQDRLRDIKDPVKSPYKGRLAREWPDPITMEKGIKKGLSEEDDVVNTLDTCQPRTLVDVMYRSDYFRSMRHEVRSMASKIGGYAVKMVWARTGAGDLAHMAIQTHDASLDFLDRHLEVIRAIKFMAEANITTVKVPGALDEAGNPTNRVVGKVSRWIEASRAAALLYLMAASNTDSEAYRSKSPPTEEEVDFSAWDDAEDFWVGLCDDGPDFQEVRNALARLVSDHKGDNPTPDEKIMVIWNAWNKYRAGEPFKMADLYPKYTVYKDSDGNVTQRVMKGIWNFGGIDLLPTLEKERADERARRLGEAPQPPQPPTASGSANGQPARGKPVVPAPATASAPATLADDEDEPEPQDQSEESEEDVIVDQSEAEAGDEVVQEATEEEIEKAKQELRPKVPDKETPAQERARRAKVEATATVKGGKAASKPGKATTGKPGAKPTAKPRK